MPGTKTDIPGFPVRRRRRTGCSAGGHGDSSKKTLVTAGLMRLCLSAQISATVFCRSERVHLLPARGDGVAFGEAWNFSAPSTRQAQIPMIEMAQTFWCDDRPGLRQADIHVLQLSLSGTVMSEAADRSLPLEGMPSVWRGDSAVGIVAAIWWMSKGHSLDPFRPMVFHRHQFGHRGNWSLPRSGRELAQDAWFNLPDGKARGGDPGAVLIEAPSQVMPGQNALPRHGRREWQRLDGDHVRFAEPGFGGLRRGDDGAGGRRRRTPAAAVGGRAVRRIICAPSAHPRW